MTMQSSEPAAVAKRFLEAFLARLETMDLPTARLAVWRREVIGD